MIHVIAALVRLISFNFLFLRIVVSYSGGALNTLALFSTDECNAWLSLNSFVVFAVHFTLTVFVLFEGRPDSSTRRVS